MKKGNFWLPLVFLIVFSAQSANAVVMDFEDLFLDTVYTEPNSFSTSGIDVLVGEFYPYSVPALIVGPIFGGTATVQNLGQAGVSGNELNLNNVNLQFLLGASGHPTGGIALAFGYYGGGVNLGVNGVRKEYLSMYDVNGDNIGGADIMVVIGGGGLGSMMVINSDIQTFLIGGQELVIDSVHTKVPEPTTIALLGLGGLSLLTIRNKELKINADIN